MLNRTSVSLLGPPIEHRDALNAVLAGHVERLTCLPDSQSFLRGRRPRLRMRVRRLLDQVWGTGDAEYTRHALKAVDNSDTRLVIGFWGTIPLADLAALKKARPGVKAVLLTLCYPLALRASGIARQNFLMRRAARFLDGVIYPSEEMAEYFRTRVFGGDAVPSLVLPPCWPASYQSAGRAAPAAAAPNLVYAGRTDIFAPTAHAADDLRPLMREVLEAGVDLHHVCSPETDDGHPRRKPFRPLPLPGLIEMMAGFDASLIAYNTGVCARDDRFRLTVPDRLLTTVAAGVPVAIPATGYSAAKSYLKGYPAVIEFESAAALARELADRRRVAALRDAARNARGAYTAERHGPRLREFLGRLL